MLNKIIQFSIRQKLIIGLMTIALIIWGIWSANKIPVDAVPDITNNQVQVITITPNPKPQTPYEPPICSKCLPIFTADFR